ncbi:Pyrrolidone-carboxylate peptidase [Thalassoglobus neptunius]|uniref:Pyroglutamyl-peptidase I n=1 Tax=Thalassoglobus neptunius TaxID=1938619 RepID=A0A5C5X1A9_9PLAN|nr:hypothetical protein [Thalassoglobus neptunius]TWT56787.1 Pyrrolidone-carboxylate peptidase [Thalassoglobus neptunius]
MKFAITGFPAFPGTPSNPTHDLVDIINQNTPLIDGHFIEAFLLPVEYNGVEIALNQILEMSDPDVVLSFGVGRHKETLRLETCGENLDDASIPDNSNELRQGTPILSDQSQYLDCPHRVDLLLEVLQQSGVRSELSQDAGRYVCNHLLYYANLLEQSSQSHFKFLFTHVPSYENGFQMEQTLTGLQIMIRWFAAQKN